MTRSLRLLRLMRNVGWSAASDDRRWRSAASHVGDRPLNHRSNHRLFLRTSASALFACSALALSSQAHGQAAPAAAPAATAPVALPVPFPPSLIPAKTAGALTNAQ